MYKKSKTCCNCGKPIAKGNACSANCWSKFLRLVHSGNNKISEELKDQLNKSFIGESVDVLI